MGKLLWAERHRLPFETDVEPHFTNSFAYFFPVANETILARDAMPSSNRK